MNILHEIGVQSWRLRGRTAVSSDQALAVDDEPLESSLMGQGDEISNSQRAGESTQGRADSMSLMSALEGSSDDHSGQLGSSSDLVVRSAGDAGQEQGSSAKSAEISEPESPLSSVGLEKAKSVTNQTDKSNDDSNEIRMPVLRPAPVPLDSTPAVDLTFDKEAPAQEQRNDSEEVNALAAEASDGAPDYSDVFIPEPEDSDEYVDVGIVLPVEAPVPEIAYKEADPAVTELAELDWRTLQLRISNQQACPSCGQGHSILGGGDVLADWVFISDAPTSSEIQANQLFLKRAGQLYEAILHASGLSREQVYTTTVFKCAPPDDLSVSPQCNKLIHRQIELVQPKVIVTLGELSAQSVLRANETLETLQSREHRYHASDCRVIPSHSLQQLLAEPVLKGVLWKQLQSVLSQSA